MSHSSAKELSDELSRLMMEQIESLNKEAFVGLDEKELRRQEDRLKRIREISADFLKALERADPQTKVEPPAPEERKENNERDGRKAKRDPARAG